ncbi:HAMP domain-containing sensor histidine kinase [Chromatiaceae bacterium AAb-1]|nr:HAMP domain-containing sensor histidine kinase [Chromatiaceae bacterium AAb-1]
MYILLFTALLLLCFWYGYRLYHLRHITQLLQSSLEKKIRKQLLLETRLSEKKQLLDESAMMLSLRTRQLEQTQAELLSARQQLHQFEQLKEEFLVAVSNELRTPLTAIRGVIGLMTQHVITPGSEMYQEMLETASHNSERLSEQINNMLDLQKLTMQYFPLLLTEVNFAELVNHAVHEMLPYAKRFNIELVLENEYDREVWVLADPLRLHQVIDNLISNAVKFSPENAVVTVRLIADEAEARLYVIDYGAGISPVFHSTLFEIFSPAAFAAEHATTGMGLGLAICKKIIDVHQGVINFNSESGKGTTFWFCLKRSTLALEKVARKII